VRQPVREQDLASTEDLLDPTELTILISWAEAAAEALADGAEAEALLLAHARAGAEWRSQLGIEEPSPQLTEAIAALCKILSITEPVPGRQADLASVMSAIGADSQDRNELEWVARQVLRSAISSRCNEVLRTASPVPD
jgi:hypothetical protein